MGGGDAHRLMELAYLRTQRNQNGFSGRSVGCWPPTFLFPAANQSSALHFSSLGFFARALSAHFLLSLFTATNHKSMLFSGLPFASSFF